MALTASDLISAAKKRTFGQVGRQKVSDAMLLEELSYQDQLIVQMFSQIAPHLLARQTGSISITEVGNTNGYTLESAIHYRDFVHANESDDEYVSVNIVQRQHRESNPSAPAGMLRLSGSAALFYPIDPEGERWEGDSQNEWFDPDSNHKVTYSYVPLPGALSSGSDTLTSPDMAREVLVTSLELKILLAASGTFTGPRAQANQQAIQAALAKRQGMVDSLRMQAYKFGHPAGQPGGRGDQRSDSLWIHDQVTG